jgi:Holliday junction resolvase RusA-like endonuclease
MKVTLPKPPSINHIYGFTATGGFARSYITKEGKAWFEEAGYMLKAQCKRKKPIETPCEMWVILHTARIQDVDNVLKPILDLFQKQGIIKNDNLIYKLDIEKFKVKVGEEKIEVELMGYAD